jgi:hypothetical protein
MLSHTTKRKKTANSFASSSAVFAVQRIASKTNSNYWLNPVKLSGKARTGKYSQH